MYAVVGLGLSGTMTTSIYNGLDETDFTVTIYGD